MMVRRRRRQGAQALVEGALVIPLLMLMVFGGVSVGRLIQARMALSAATREAARATALADMPNARRTNDDEARREAIEDGERHGRGVARDYGLNGAEFNVTVDRFEPGGWVTAEGRYEVNMFGRDLFGTAVQMHASHVERIDRWRSLSPP
jgi:hypothetical protein